MEEDSYGEVEEDRGTKTFGVEIKSNMTRQKEGCRREGAGERRVERGEGVEMWLANRALRCGWQSPLIAGFERQPCSPVHAFFFLWSILM